MGLLILGTSTKGTRTGKESWFQAGFKRVQAGSKLVVLCDGPVGAWYEIKGDEDGEGGEGAA